MKMIKYGLAVIIVILLITFIQNIYYEKVYHEDYVEVYYLTKPVMKNDKVSVSDFNVIKVVNPPDGVIREPQGVYSEDLSEGKIIMSEDVSNDFVEENRMFALIEVNAQYGKLFNLKIGQEISLFHEYKGIVDNIGVVTISRIGTSDQSMLVGNGKLNIVIAASKTIIEKVLEKVSIGDFLLVISN